MIIRDDIDQVLRRERPSVAVLDAGVGGLTVVGEILKKTNEVDILYFGDSRNMPYNTRTNDWIEGRAQFLIQMLEEFTPEILIGCNTISAVAGNLRSKANVRDIIRPTVDWLGIHVRGGRLVIMGTKTTIGSRAYETQVTNTEIIRVICPYLPTIIDRHGWDSDETAAQLKLEVDSAIPVMKCDRAVLVLGCTHFPLVRDFLVEAVKARLTPDELTVVDPGTILADSLPLSAFAGGRGKVTVCLNRDDSEGARISTVRLLHRLGVHQFDIHFLDLPCVLSTSGASCFSC